MTIAKLKQLPIDKRKAALVAMEDGDLDRIAAEAKGWEYHDLTQWSCNPSQPHPRVYIKWHPSTDLNQAYELVDATGMGIHRWDYQSSPTVRYAIALGNPRETVTEKEARTHARAVTILAVLGLLAGNS